MTYSLFDSIRHINEYDQEYWSARELRGVLGHDGWEGFKGAIERAIESCKSSKQKPQDHFLGAGKMIELRKGGKNLNNRLHVSIICIKNHYKGYI